MANVRITINLPTPAKIAVVVGIIIGISAIVFAKLGILSEIMPESALYGGGGSVLFLAIVGPLGYIGYKKCVSKPLIDFTQKSSLATDRPQEGRTLDPSLPLPARGKLGFLVGALMKYSREGSSVRDKSVLMNFFHRAADEKREDITDLFLVNANFSFTAEEIASAFVLACEKDDVILAQRLLEKGPIDRSLPCWGELFNKVIEETGSRCEDLLLNPKYPLKDLEISKLFDRFVNQDNAENLRLLMRKSSSLDWNPTLAKTFVHSVKHKKYEITKLILAQKYCQINPGDLANAFRDAFNQNQFVLAESILSRTFKEVEEMIDSSLKNEYERVLTEMSSRFDTFNVSQRASFKRIAGILHNDQKWPTLLPTILANAFRDAFNSREFALAEKILEWNDYPIDCDSALECQYTRVLTEMRSHFDTFDASQSASFGRIYRLLYSHFWFNSARSIERFKVSS